MALGGRELLLVLRARDLVSRDLERVSANLGIMQASTATTSQKMLGVAGALTAAGVGMSIVGGAGVAFFVGAYKAAQDYNQQVALTQTQTQGLNLTFGQLADVGRQVANEIPAPFEEMQGGLFDIFSSMDVNLSQSKKLLENFAKGAVAGQTDVQDAAKASIAIMNAFKIPVSDVSHVMDVQFQLVAKGVGTYKDFSGAIGRSIPSAVKAGQSVDTLAGMLAFLTRNGLSANMASTSAARALDAMVNPKVVQNMKDIGVSMYDTTGKARPLTDVLSDLQDKMKGMSQQKKVEFLTDLFKGGGGNIQAMRFFNLAFSNMDEFKQRVKDMKNSSGAMATAYNTMFKQPQSQVQLLSNRYQTMKTEIGDKLVPVALKLVSVGTKLLGMWDKLSPKTKDMIVKVAAFASVVMVVVGAVLVIVGVLAGFVAILTTLGIGVGVAVGILALIPVVIAAIIGGVILLVTHWSTAKDIATNVWAKIKDLADKARDAFDAFIAKVKGPLLHVWKDIQDAASKFFGFLQKVIGLITRIGSDLWKGLKDNGVFTRLSDKVQEMWQRIQPVFDKFLNVLKTLADLFKFVFGIIMTVLSFFVQVALDLWNSFGSKIIKIISDALKLVIDFVSNVFKIIMDIFGIFADLFTGHWGDAWKGVLQLFKDIWHLIQTVFSDAFKALISIFKFLWALFKAAFVNGWNAVINFVSTWAGKLIGMLRGAGSWLVSAGTSVVKGLLNGMKFIWGSVISWLAGLGLRVIRGVGNIANVLYDIGKKLINGLWNGMKHIWHNVTGWLGGIGSKIKNLKGPPEKDAILLYENGTLLMKGLHAGLKNGWGKVESWLGEIAPQVQGSFDVSANTRGGIGGGSIPTGNGKLIQLILQAGAIVVQGGDPEENAKAINKTLQDLITELTRS